MASSQLLSARELVIDDGYDHDALYLPRVNGEPMGRGLILPEDEPARFGDAPSEFIPFDKQEIIDRAKEAETRKTRISDNLLAQNIPSTNQRSDGYCWSYSVGGCIIAQRAMAGLKYVPINPHGPAAIIKKGRNEGGWCGLSQDWSVNHGYPTTRTWPENSRDLRNDNAASRADMALHKVTEDWVDVSKAVYDRNLAFLTICSLLVIGVPVAGDFSWWSHSVLLCDVVVLDGEPCIRLRNSWGDSWGEKGFSVLQGQKRMTMGAVAIRASEASPI